MKAFNLRDKCMNSRHNIVKKASVPEFPNTPEDENRKISVESREHGMAEPIIQKGRDRYKMGRRIPKSSCKVGKDTN